MTLPGKPSGRLDQRLDGRTHAGQQVLGLPDAFARDRHHALDQRLVLLHGLVDRIGRRGIAHHGAHVDRECGRGRHLAPRNGRDQLFLTALRVFHLEGHHLDALIPLGQTAQVRNGVGFVVLDPDIGFLHGDGLHQDRHAHEQLLTVLQHRTVVGRKVRLALYTVDNQRFGLFTGRNREFHVRGERRAAHADDAGVLDPGDDLLCRERALPDDRLRAVDPLGPVVALALDRNHHLAQPLPVGHHVHGRYRPRNRGVNVGRHKAARLGDELPRHDLVALGDLGHGGGADVLCERDRHHVGQRKHLDRFGAAQFIFRRMDSAYWKCLHILCFSDLTVLIRLSEFRQPAQPG